MTRKLALKRLTASDLTLFKWHYQNRPAGNQKGVNLNAKTMVRELYPQLGQPSSVPKPRYPIDLYLYGPGLAGAINLQRKILKEQKNWRLNGEFIDNPEGDPDRFNQLQPDDYALFEFSGDVVPDTAHVVLIACSNEYDRRLHEELQIRSPSDSMWVVDEGQISAVIEAASLDDSHPLLDLVDSGAVEDAVLGGIEGTTRVMERRGGRGISPEDFQRSRLAAEQTGVSGEELLNEYLEKRHSAGDIESFEWSSRINAVSPYDFRITYPGGEEHLVDAKSTSGDFSNPIHLSLNELRTAAEGGIPYDIYRLYQVGEGTAKLRIARAIGPGLGTVLTGLAALPQEVSVDSVSVRPGFLAFEEPEIELTSADDEAEE